MLLVFALIVAASQASADTLRLAVTTSFQNSGLSAILLPEIKADLGLDVHLLVVGTGQALRLGEAGDVDAILVHARAAEEAFVAAGYGTYRREIMVNDFVILGPSSDPAAVKTATTAIDALGQIAQAEAPFVSRGDDSGTHKKELSLWSDAGQNTEAFGPWYMAVGSGMGATLNTASGLNAYVLSDRASWLSFGNKGDLAVAFEGDPALFNQYAFLPVNPQIHPHVKAQRVLDLEAWLTSHRARELINGYRLHGAQLFTFNAEAEPTD